MLQNDIALVTGASRGIGQAIAKALHVSEGSVEKHVTAVFQKLDLEPDQSGNRRVLAALAHLEHGGPRPQEPGGPTPQSGANR